MSKYLYMRFDVCMGDDEFTVRTYRGVAEIMDFRSHRRPQASSFTTYICRDAKALAYFERVLLNTNYRSGSRPVEDRHGAKWHWVNDEVREDFMNILRHSDVKSSFDERPGDATYDDFESRAADSAVRDGFKRIFGP